MTNKNDALPVAERDQVVGRVYDGKAELNSAGRALADHSELYSVEVIANRDAELAEFKRITSELAGIIAKLRYDYESAFNSGEIARQSCDQLQAELAALRGRSDRAYKALEKLSRVPGCGCSFPCTCGGDEWTRAELEGRMDYAMQAVAEFGAPLVSDKAGAVDERELFNAEYEKVCNRPITHREIAWRVWQARAALNPLAADVAQFRAHDCGGVWRESEFVKAGGCPKCGPDAADVAQGGEVGRLRAENAKLDEQLGHCGDFEQRQIVVIHGLLDDLATQTARADAAEPVLRVAQELSSYLDGNKANSVHTGSILHGRLKEALQRAAVPAPTEQKAQPVAADVVQVPRAVLENSCADSELWYAEFGEPSSGSYTASFVDLRALLATRQADGGSV